MTDSTHILVMDSYDSFVYTTIGYLQTLSATIGVVHNNAIDPATPGVPDGYGGVLTSPDPGAPAESGASEDMIRLYAASDIPMFGVYLGLQVFAEVCDYTMDHTLTIMHGKINLVKHIDDETFEGVANPITATRYHSLAVEPDSVPDTLAVTVWTQGNYIIQGVRAKGKPIYAIQLHLESVMTQDDYRLLANWLKVCGQDNAMVKSTDLQPKVTK